MKQFSCLETFSSRFPSLSPTYVHQHTAMPPQSGQGGGEGEQVHRAELIVTSALSIVACKVYRPDVAELHVSSLLGTGITVRGHGMRKVLAL